MWVAIVIIFFLGTDGALHESEFRSSETYASATECLQAAGTAVVQALPENNNVRGYAVACQREETV